MVKRWPPFLPEPDTNAERVGFVSDSEDIRGTIEYRLLRLRMAREQPKRRNAMLSDEIDVAAITAIQKRPWSSSLERTRPQRFPTRPHSCLPGHPGISEELGSLKDSMSLSSDANALNESLQRSHPPHVISGLRAHVTYNPSNSVEVVRSRLLSGIQRTPSICISSADETDDHSSRNFITFNKMQTIEDDIGAKDSKKKKNRLKNERRKIRRSNSETKKMALSSTIARKGFQMSSKNCILDPILQKVTVHIRNYKKPDEKVTMSMCYSSSVADHNSNSVTEDIQRLSKRKEELTRKKANKVEQRLETARKRRFVLRDERGDEEERHNRRVQRLHDTEDLFTLPMNDATGKRDRYTVHELTSARIDRIKTRTRSIASMDRKTQWYKEMKVKFNKQ